MDASIIICTCNRADKLRETLQSLAALNVAPGHRHEIIVVDNKSHDDTRQVVASWSDRLPVRYVFEGTLGLSVARNTGINASTGRIILFTDDDCTVRPDWLTVGLDLLSSNPLQVIGGRVDLHDPTDLPMTIKTDDQPASLAGVRDLLGFLHGCNMIFGRCVIEKIGLFDTRLGAGTPCRAGEDSDFVYRALKHGVPVLYEPGLRMSHSHGRKAPADERRLLDGYNVSVGALAVKGLIRGDVSILKLAYWDLLRESAGLRRARMMNYARGAVRFGRTLFARAG